MSLFTKSRRWIGKKVDTWVERYVIGSSSRQRAVYLQFRRSAMRRRLAERREMAKRLRSKAPFEIPADKGYLVFQPGELSQAADVGAEAAQLTKDFTSENVEFGQKPHIKTKLLDVNDLTMNSVYVQFALHPDIIAVAAAYLGVVPIIAALDVWYSRFHAGGMASSQLYHCDWADETQVKIFVYATNVEESSGPLTVMDADASRDLRKQIGYRYRGKRYRVTDDDVAKIIGDKSQHVMTGPAGTVLFVDTSRCFHYGSRLHEKARPRTVAVIQYLRPESFALPLNHRPTALLRHLATPDSSRMQQLVLGLA